MGSRFRIWGSYERRCYAPEGEASSPPPRGIRIGLLGGLFGVELVVAL